MFHATVLIALLIFIVPVTNIITLLAQEKHTSGMWNVSNKKETLLYFSIGMLKCNLNYI